MPAPAVLAAVKGIAGATIPSREAPETPNRIVGAADEATQIGQAMLEVAARGAEFENGDKLSTGRIIRYSDAYRLAKPVS